MEWDLAGYGEHPIDGDADRVASLAAHLGSMTADIRSQLERIRALDSADFWVSSAGSAEAFQGVVEDIPEKLELVATRYESVASALDAFHPTLADTKQDAEYWIQQAETAKAEADRTQSGVEDMEEFEDNAEDGQEWEGQDYRAANEAAEGDLQTAIDNVRNAVSAFESAADRCADEIHDAGDDDLENEGGLFGAIGRAWDSFTDVLAEWVDIIDLLATILGVAALLFGWVPILGQILIVAALVVSIVSLLAHTALAASGKGSWLDVGIAALGVLTGGGGRLLGGATRGLARLGSRLGPRLGSLGRMGSRVANFAGRTGRGTRATETFYRGMSRAEFDDLARTGRLSLLGGKGEKFVTQDLNYIRQLAARHPGAYERVVQFQMQAGTRNALLAAGRRSPGGLLEDMGLGHLPMIQKGMPNVVHVKGEFDAVNYGLRSGSINIFNDRIVDFTSIAL